MPPYVTDQVWSRLDPSAGRLSRRTAVRGSVAVAVALVLLVAGSLVWSAGLVVPRLVWPNDGRDWEENPDWVRVHVLVLNDGSWPVTVRDIGRSGPGMQLLGVEGWERGTPSPFPVTLAAHTGIGATLVYRVTDCAGYPRGSWPVTAVVERPWGVMTVDVVPGHDWPQWQEDIVSTWCRPGGPRG